jgi:hypothetical protein
LPKSIGGANLGPPRPSSDGYRLKRASKMDLSIEVADIERVLRTAIAGMPRRLNSTPFLEEMSGLPGFLPMAWTSLFRFAQSTYISPSTALVPTVTVGRMRDLFFGLGSREPKA